MVSLVFELKWNHIYLQNLTDCKCKVGDSTLKVLYETYTTIIFENSGIIGKALLFKFNKDDKQKIEL